MIKRRTNSWVLFVIVLGILSVVLYSFEHRPAHTIPVEKISLSRLTSASTTVSVEIVRTPDEQVKGLSGRNALPEGKGMLFVFDSLDAHPFWMPDMRFAIDMIWIGKDLRIVDIKADATPESYPAVFKSKTPALYVLEVPSGFAARSGWVIGTELAFDTSTSPPAQQ